MGPSWWKVDWFRLRTYQLPLPPPCFLVLDGDSPAYPALPKYFGKWSSGAAVPLARPAWLRSVSLWERVTVGDWVSDACH
jgi:hypothetical protein